MFRSPSAEPESKHDMETEETKSPAQKILRDKCCQTDRHHGCCDSDKLVEPGDPPLLQQPVQTSKSGILQIIECFRSGTKQLRVMLLREVDTIFECKSCRSLFRGLPNLITHKQFYCLSKFQMDEDPPNGNNQSQVVKDLVESVYPRTNNPEVVIQLEAIQTNQNAVFQIIKPASDVNLDITMSDSAGIQKEESVTASQKSLTPETEILPSENATVEDTSSFLNVDNPSVPSFVARSAKKASNSNPFLCRVCKKDFNCRRSIRRHIKKVHKKKSEDIKKFIEVQRNTPLSSTKGLANIVHSTSKSCHICQKSFATKANTRRHIDEVHRGMRRDSLITESSIKPGKNMTPEIAIPKNKVKTISHTKKCSSKSDFSIASFPCSICKRRYTSKYLLKKHMQMVHKSTQSEKIKSDERHVAITNGKMKLEDSSSNSGTSSPQSESKGTKMEKKSGPTAKSKIKSDEESPKTVSSPKTLSSPASDKKKCRKPKLSAGFDFKQLYCKLCKRQFTSKQNLAKHIELHTDGNCIFVKFYRCPLCSYETRRKRDVIRHITVVHKKTQRALIKITSNLESRVIKKPIECIMDKSSKKCHKKEKGKKDPSLPSSKKNDGGVAGIEVKVTKTFSLLKCKTCGKAFAKKKDLEQHKKNHKVNSNNLPVDIKNKGRSTRSKTPVS